MLTAIPKRERASFAVERFEDVCARSVEDMVAAEEPLEIQLAFGKRDARQSRPITITIRTPGNDAELTLGFLFSEGVIHDADEVRPDHALVAGLCVSPYAATSNTEIAGSTPTASRA